MDDILQRGENIESLMTKSADLSSTSVQFYRTAKKNNQCCQVHAGGFRNSSGPVERTSSHELGPNAKPEI